MTKRLCCCIMCLLWVVYSKFRCGRHARWLKWHIIIKTFGSIRCCRRLIHCWGRLCKCMDILRPTLSGKSMTNLIIVWWVTLTFSVVKWGLHIRIVYKVQNKWWIGGSGSRRNWIWLETLLRRLVLLLFVPYTRIKLWVWRCPVLMSGGRPRLRRGHHRESTGGWNRIVAEKFETWGVRKNQTRDWKKKSIHDTTTYQLYLLIVAAKLSTRARFYDQGSDRKKHKKSRCVAICMNIFVRGRSVQISNWRLAQWAIYLDILTFSRHGARKAFDGD